MEDHALQLSKRLLRVAEFAAAPGDRDTNHGTADYVVADIGTDHGYIPLHMITHGMCDRALAMDVRKGPLSRAIANVTAHGLDAQIECRLSDGCHELKAGEADTIVCAGMGGKLMQQIISAVDLRALGVKWAVLQPQSEILEFRRGLRDRGYLILDDDVLLDEGKYYFLMKVDLMPEHLDDPSMDKLKDKAPGAGIETLTRISDRYGCHSILQANTDLQDFLEHRKIVCQQIIGEFPEGIHYDKKDELVLEMEDIDLTLTIMGK